MHDTDSTDDRLVRAYFKVLYMLVAVDSSLRCAAEATGNTARLIALYTTIESEYLRCGYRSLLPACGALLPQADLSFDQVAHLVARRLPNEAAVFYAGPMRKRLEKLLLSAGCKSYPSGQEHILATS